MYQCLGYLRRDDRCLSWLPTSTGKPNIYYKRGFSKITSPIYFKFGLAVPVFERFHILQENTLIEVAC